MKKFLKENYLVLLILLFSIAGFVAAFDLSVEKVALLKDSKHVVSCSINAVFDCATVMKTPYAEMFGFPNSFMGIAGYAMAFVTALFLFDKQKMNKYLAYFTTFLPFLGFLISYYWLYLSAYVIGVFCPWCLVSTTSTTTIFFALVTLHLYHNNYQFKDKTATYFKKQIDLGWNIPPVLLWYILAICYAAYPFVFGL